MERPKRQVDPFAFCQELLISCTQLEEFLAWLNTKGVRELALKNALLKWYNHIMPGMRRRASVRGKPFELAAVHTHALTGPEHQCENTRGTSLHASEAMP